MTTSGLAAVRTNGSTTASFEVTLAAAAEGDDRAVRWLVERYHEGMLDYARRSGAPDANGVVDLVLTRVLRRLDRLDDPTEQSLEIYLFRSLRREINREISRHPGRRRRIEVIDLDEGQDTEDLIVPSFEDRVDDVDLVGDLLDRLTDRQRMIVVEHFLNDRAYDDIGDELGQSASAVRKTSSRAISKLRAALATAVALGLVGLLVTRSPEATTIDVGPAEQTDEGVPLGDRPVADDSDFERSSGRIAAESPGADDAADPTPTTTAAPPSSAPEEATTTTAAPSTTAPTTTPEATTTPTTVASAPFTGNAFGVDIGRVTFSRPMGSTLAIGERLDMTIEVRSTGNRRITIDLLTFDNGAIRSPASTPTDRPATVAQWIRLDQPVVLDRIRLVVRDVGSGETWVSEAMSVDFRWSNDDDATADLGDDRGDGWGDDGADDGGVAGTSSTYSYVYSWQRR